MEQLKFLVLNGPNLDLLGEREPQVYGAMTLGDLETLCREWGKERGIEIFCAQDNSEGGIIDRLHAARHEVHGVVLNAAGYTHTSVAIRDAVAALPIPVIEVHLSNVTAREPFRHRSYLSPVASGIIIGFGETGYLLALEGLVQILEKKKRT